MITRRELTGMPPEHVRLAWCDWLRWHTIDPCDVAVIGFIEIDTDARQVRWLSYDLNDKGHKYFDPKTQRAAQSVHVMQLEAVPSPFPDICS